MHPENPLIIQSDLTILVEVDSPRYEEARICLGRFAELVKMPEHVHTYRLTALSVWNACAVGVDIGDLLDGLEDLAKYPLPPSVPPQLREMATRFGAIRLVRPANDTRLALVVMRPGLAAEFERLPAVAQYLGPRSETGDAFAVDPAWRGPLKRALIKVGWPVDDLAGYEDGEKLPISLLPVCRRDGMPMVLRDYQRQAVERIAGPHAPGAGVIVLPCGAGKTIVGLAAMAALGEQTLILTSSVSATHQWIAEILDKTDLDPSLVGEYSGEKKEIKPVTIATYQILTHRRVRKPAPVIAPANAAAVDGTEQSPGDGTVIPGEDITPQFSHFALFDAMRWGLVIYDEVHLLPAPLFQAAASVQSRRRLGLTATLIREDGLESDVFALVGPKLHEIPWRDLEKSGWIAPAVCTEIRVPMPESMLIDYATAGPRHQPQIAAANPFKHAWVAALLARHPGEPTLVISTYLEPLAAVATELGLPVLDGSTPQKKRDAVFAAFRRGEIPALAVSRIANFSIDLPDASVAIQISGQFGSRQEEAQRLGRLLRPKAPGRRASFYTLVTADTIEQDFAHKRQLFLCEQGYEYRLHSARSQTPDPDNLSDSIPPP